MSNPFDGPAVDCAPNLLWWSAVGVVAAIDGSWRRYGIVGRALEQEQYAMARAQVARRVSELVSPLRRAAA